MPWLCAIIETAEESVEILSDALLEVGALAVDVQDAAAGTVDERPIFAEPGEAPVSGWHTNRVGALFAVDADLYALVPEALAAARLSATSAFSIERVEDADWVRLTQSQFHPIQITPLLWVVPSWHTPPDGTGAHPTTRLCLRWLAETVTPDADVLDYGCGSGILAIAAMKLGAANACGIDIDPQAVLAAQQNAQNNGVDITLATAEQDVAGLAQIVVANILANPLTVLAPLLARLTRPGGRIALSGILVEQADAVLEAYAPKFTMMRADTDEGWVLLTGRRNPQ
jgi:ribosomal protein L11 methyltransferase